MGNKMLIDAAHPEETRVVVARSNNRIEELDYEAADRKQLRGNIYLAKVTRVEPSLQAAFVDYGGNRHGFLAFNEIHPDYYQIPIADRQALLEQEAADDRADEEENDDPSQEARTVADQSIDADGEGADDEPLAATDSDEGDDDDTDQDTNGAGPVESVGAGDALEDIPDRMRPRRRSYKIQEVIKRRQIILVQVVKEERGNKGAALTTYLSLAGRYCVLMPNTARGGGISRKITDAQDRKRLKDVAKSADVPDGMGLIVRTAGANRTKAEVKRDFDYLLRLWENVRDLTLVSTAPCLVYEEGSLIKRAIRDLYTKDIESIIVEGDEGYKEAKEFMRMLMPSHARHIKLYKDSQPLFMRYSIENQLDVLFSPYVTLPSGGYIVINQTEALVSVDVNSGKATREHNIEDTALKTNLEAADEVSRQMRLRDLAGLLVIDFIDMEERRNNRSVERRVKERLKSDRARIQVGRISHFGLLEMSRQRMRTGVLESSTRPCPTCEGRGFVRSVQSASLQVLRGVEDYLQKNNTKDHLTVQAPREVALYILNQKRDHLLTIEANAGVSVFIESDDSLLNSEFAVERTSGSGAEADGAAHVIQVDSPFTATTTGEAHGEDENGTRQKKRRRRRGRRSGRSDSDLAATEESIGEAAVDGQAAEDSKSASDASPDDREGERKPRRGSRGGRRRRGRGAQSRNDDGPEATASLDNEATAEAEATDLVSEPAGEDTEAAGESAAAEEKSNDAKPKRAPRARPSRRRKPATNGADASAVEGSDDVVSGNGTADPATAQLADEAPASSVVEEDVNGSVAGDQTPASPDQDATTPVVTTNLAPAEEPAGEDTPPPAPEPVVVEDVPPAAPRRGWWQRR